LIEGGHHSALVVSGEHLYFRRNDFAHPDELYRSKLDGSDVEKLTGLNDSRVAQALMGTYEQLSFEGAGGDTVYGWVVRPAEFDPSKKYPLAFLIHGGPQGSFSNRFHYRWNPQTYAGAGFVAVIIDFHGSVGYGQAFTDAIRGDWGGKPLEDLQKGLAAAAAKYPFIDANNGCALGASYGGYMINWIAGAWPDQFKCLVNHDGIFDQRSMYWSTEELWFPEWEHGGPYHLATEGHERHNPMSLVDKWKTPMLVVHGALDHRVPLEQGLQTFNALQRRGIESKLLYYPDENHWVLKPKNSLQWHREVTAWLKTHTAQ
jgi:dipeptidyl aminopeptidase/acylaminoacyl peptidase